VVTLEYSISRKVLGRSRVGESADLEVWTNTVPKIVEIQGDPDFIHLTVEFPADVPHHYYRLLFKEQ